MPEGLAKIAAQFGPTVFLAVACLLAVGWLFNEYDKRGRISSKDLHDAHSKERDLWQAEHRAERRDWQASAERAAERTVSKLEQILLDINRRSNQ